ncbi:MAG: alpha/beta hydrolase-fold protein [Polaribacter sp.]|uniref:alpha/beta hydrolase n=1 Tax=Polaribacter sp. TaxID=1920175 RepID=UPI003BAF8BC3
MKNVFILFSILITFSCKSQNTETKKEQNKYSNITTKVLENSVLAGGKLIRVDSFPSKNIVPRPVDVWLPENYSSEKKYAVLYMHDGQNLFDETTTWNKQEWKIDEVATQLMKDGVVRDFIVVGIHNIPQIRWQDLFPEKAMDFLSKEDKDALYEDASKNNFNINLKGDEYLKFLVNELKPYINDSYSVYTNKENTFVAGSSMGGLMSMYAVAEYPEVFEGAACISTHWVGGSPKENNALPQAIFEYLEENLPSTESHKMYFDYGNKTLDQYYPQYAPKVDSIFKNGGYSDSNFKNLFFEGTNHSELSWQKRVDIPLTFLLKK